MAVLHPHTSLRYTILPAVVVLLVGLILRTWQLHTYPPGPHYDEAVEVLITRSIAFGGANLFPIVNSYQGREALFYYVSAPFFHLIADDVFTLRVVNVFANMLTLAASIALGRAMFLGQRGWTIGLAIGVMFALSFPQIWLSRQAFRTPVLPLCQVMALWCLWRGLNAKGVGWGWLAFGGFFAGAALYTYMASRLFPVWLVLGGLCLMAVDAGQRLRRLRQGMVFFGVLALTALPMAIYAVQNPDIFFQRLSEVGPGAGTITLGESILIHAKMFFIQGEWYYRYNIPGRPYLTPVEGVFLVIGAVICVVRILQAGKGSERAAYLMALLSPLMVLPSVISVGGLPPNHMRSVGMVPLIFVMAAVGVEWVLQRIALKPEQARVLVTGLAIACVSVGGMLVGSEYFAWASRTDVYEESDGDLDAAAKWLNATVTDGERVYIATRYREHPTVVIQHVPNVVWLGVDSLFRPPGGADGWVIIPRSVKPPEAWLAWLEPQRVTDVPLGPDRNPAFSAYRLNGDAALPYPERGGETISNATLTLVGTRMPAVFPGGQEWVELAWSVQAKPGYADLTPIVQIEDVLGTVLSRTTADFTQTDRWDVGEVLMHRMPISIPVGTPPGDYTARIAWVSRGSDTYLSYRNESGGLGGIWADVGTVEVIRPTTFPSADALDIAVQDVRDVVPGVRFLGYNPPPLSVRPGEALPVTLFWQAVPFTTERRMPVISRVRLRDENGRDTTLWAGSPVQGRYNSVDWVEGELVTDRALWSVPREQTAGNYTLVLEAGTETISLGQVEVVGTAREMDAPSVAVEDTVAFGEVVQLYGHRVEVNEGVVQVELVWQSIMETTISYTVFVHVVDENGQIIMQRDAVPQDNAYPTRLWQAGEYVRDLYRFEGLPPGTYTLRTGLYDAANGARLPIMADGQPAGDVVSLESVVIGAPENG